MKYINGNIDTISNEVGTVADASAPIISLFGNNEEKAVAATVIAEPELALVA